MSSSAGICGCDEGRWGFLAAREALREGGEEEAGGVEGEEEEGADHRQPPRLQALQQRRHHARPGKSFVDHLKKLSLDVLGLFVTRCFRDRSFSRAVFSMRPFRFPESLRLEHFSSTHPADDIFRF